MQTIKKDTKIEEAVFILQDLLREAGYNIPVDGDFGPKTDEAVRDFQLKNGLVVDGIVGDKTWRALLNHSPEHVGEAVSRFLSEDDLISAAGDLGIEVAAIKAVNEVESRGQGFIGDKPKILFEGHIFWKQLKAHGLNPQSLRQGNEDILYPSWTKEHYIGGLGEHTRLEKAKRIHEGSAIESASWGRFQIMGFHWKSLEYKSAKEFANLMYKNEGEHLKAFARFIKSNNLARYLKSRNWAEFARRYNGPGYKKNKYDEKLERAYERYK